MKIKASTYFGAAILLIVGLLVFTLVQPQPGEAVKDMGNEHIDTIESSHEAYNSLPPTSGPHIGTIASWGIHSEQIADELQIHNLEDGGVMVQYDPAQVDAEAISTMKRIVNEYPTEVILAPYESLPSPIALTAWGRLQYLDAVDENMITDFINAYRGIDHHLR